MTRTIFRNTFFFGLTILAICVLLFFALQYSRTIDDTFEELEQESDYAVKGYNSAGEDYLETLNEVNRVTLMDNEGNVLYDSWYDLPLSNQKGYEEIKESLSDGSGMAMRRSLSGHEDTMYYAAMCSDGNILRLSRPMRTVQDAFLFVTPVFWILVLILLISFLFAFHASRQLVTPINKMDLDDPAGNPYPELEPLLKRIEEQQETIKAEISSREEVRRQFTANVSHELKTPLTSISGFAELLANGMVSEDKVSEFASDIYKESRRLIAMVDDIIKLSHLDEEEGFPDEEKLDLHAVSLEVAENLKLPADKNSVFIAVKGERVFINGVRQLIYDLVYNLADNAVKYNYPGGEVIIETGSEQGKTVLTVSDTGIGISKEHQVSVFERFYRVDKSHSKEIGGTGLGLSIVKHAASYHHADITIDSAPGQGTTIRVFFNPA